MGWWPCAAAPSEFECGEGQQLELEAREGARGREGMGCEVEWPRGPLFISGEGLAATAAMAAGGRGPGRRLAGSRAREASLHGLGGSW